MTTTGHDLDLVAWTDRCSRILDEVAHCEHFASMDPEAPWSASSLDAVESMMLSTWTSPGDLPGAAKDLYEAYLGEGLRRRVDGSWVLLEPSILGHSADDAELGRGISDPDSGSVDVISSLVPLAYRARTGTWWSTSFRAGEAYRRHGDPHTGGRAPA